MVRKTFFTRARGAVAATVLLSGCVIFSAGDDDPQANLTEHRALWDGTGIADYTFNFQRICFCNAQFIIPVRLTIRGDTIIEVFDLQEEQPIETYAPGDYLGIDELFDFLQGAIDQNAVEIDVSYDQNLGHPVDITVDFSRQRFNDDLAFQIRELQETN